ncbi:MAG: cytochrome c biogenesis protein CcsA, partial [Bryobacteraceae bacterium]|nr:cytochrome c biogenesis protein CcsA [Bryobacteraceae bacterium]
MIAFRQQFMIGCAVIAAALLSYNLYVMLLQLPDEAFQGAIFRIIFFHVPAAWTAFVCAFVALAASVLYLVRRNLRYDDLAVAATEVGLAFGAVNLITGMIWARIIWGIWWTWDARLTSMLILWLAYAGYMMLRKAIEDPTQRARIAAVLSIFIFVDVPIVVFSIKWWR